jgi:hypothetical protein
VFSRRNAAAHEDTAQASGVNGEGGPSRRTQPANDTPAPEDAATSHPRLPAANPFRRELPQKWRLYIFHTNYLGDAVPRAAAGHLLPGHTGPKFLRARW